MFIRNILATLAFLAATAAGAAAPLAKTPAPGYFRMMIGDIEVTAISDGTVDLPVNQLLTNTTPKHVDQVLAKNFLKSPVETSVNAFLVNTGSRLVLVDAGAGSLFGPTLGKLAANIKGAGYQPEQVDEIYITHMHPDHVGGLSANGAMLFPNAIVRADKHDADYWLAAETLEKATGDSKGFVQGAQTMFAPYVKAGKLSTFEGNSDLVPGIKAVASHGHTAGHTTYVVESQGQKLVLWGDLMHVAAVQFPEPSVTIKFDSDSKAAAVQRKKAYADAAKGGYWIAAAHLPFPGIGHIVASGKGYTYIPVNYTAPR